MTREEALNVVLVMAERGAEIMADYIYDGHAKKDGSEEDYHKALRQFEEAKTILALVGP